MRSSERIHPLRFLRRWAQSLVYSNVFYRWWLGSVAPASPLRLDMSDPWPGDAQKGQMMITKDIIPFDLDPSATLAERRFALSHDWLRDLRAVGTDTARRKALWLIEIWLGTCDRWRSESWSAGILAERIGNWIAFYDFYASIADASFPERLARSLARQFRHLRRTMPPTLITVEGLSILKALVFTSLALKEDKRALGHSIDLLQKQLAAEIRLDGGCVSRNPLQLMEMLRRLIDIRAALRATNTEIPPELATAIERMVPALKLFRHGDGGLALFNGGLESTSLDMEAVLTMAEARGRVARRLPQTGYERVVAGRSLLLVDVGAPPLWPYDRDAHAGLLSFEFSVGRERIIVNCGAGPEDDPDWRNALAATAAHSTLTIDDTNACGIRREGGIGHRPRQVKSQRYEQDDAHFIEALHDGYWASHRVTCQRLFSLTANGDELQGKETLSGQPGSLFAIRWHLHPSVDVSLLQGGLSALLRTATGNGWRFRVESEPTGVDLALEASVYCGDGKLQRTRQLKAAGRMTADPIIVRWYLSREKKTESVN